MGGATCEISRAFNQLARSDHMRELRRSNFLWIRNVGEGGCYVHRETVSGEEKRDGTNGDPDPN